MQRRHDAEHAFAADVLEREKDVVRDRVDRDRMRLDRDESGTDRSRYARLDLKCGDNTAFGRDVQTTKVRIERENVRLVAGSILRQYTHRAELEGDQFRTAVAGD